MEVKGVVKIQSITLYRDTLYMRIKINSDTVNSYFRLTS